MKTSSPFLIKKDMRYFYQKIFPKLRLPVLIFNITKSKLLIYYLTYIELTLENKKKKKKKKKMRMKLRIKEMNF
jgi:hypothetical protein